jgi:hypothetical protein
VFSSCANLACQAEFNYRQGAIFRFRKQVIKGGQPAQNDPFQHFWLCANCAEIYRLEYLPGQGVLLKPVNENIAQKGLPHLVAVA